MQVTASRTALLLECARPFSSETEIEHREPTEPMRYGSAFHEVLELNAPRADVKEIAKRWDVDALELYPHAVRTLAYLKKWLAGDNVYGLPLQVVSKETHRATNIRTLETRVCDFDAAEHVYDLRPHEFGGTEDLLTATENGAHRIVVDYKTGDYGDFHMPHTMPQMLALALQTGANAVAILHSPRGGVPHMTVDSLEVSELAAFAKRLRRAMARIGDGSMRPGGHCARCPARESCPTRDAELIATAGKMIQQAITSDALAKPVDKGTFHMFLQQLERLAKRAREVLREEVRAGEIIVRPDGQVLALRSSSFETLSKASIIRGIGKQKGERLIESLRKKGCVDTSERESLVAIKEG